MHIELPADLQSFLRARKRLVFDAAACPTGRISLHALEDLRIGNAYCAPRGRGDPNRGREGVYRVPAVSLLKSCQRFDPDYLLCFLPCEGQYAALDADHAAITVFAKASWTDISADPAPYLSALWEKKPAIPVARQARWWEKYRFHEDCFE